MMLTSADRDRLLKFLRLLASDHGGERAAAGLAAVRLLRRAGLSWDDVIARDAPATHARPRACVRHHQVVQDCLARPGSLRPWEAKFLTSLLDFARLSQKQLFVLNEIATRLGVREAA